MRVTYSPRAVLDLISIADFVSTRSPRRSMAIERRVRRVVDLLGDFPGSGRVLEQRPRIRVIPLGRYPYLIFYTVEADELIVLHIRHSARNPINPDDL